MSKSNLKSHTQLVHQEEGDAKQLMTCPFKDYKKVFQQKQKYQDHMNTHTGIKPYTCEECEREFCNRYTKTSHEKMFYYNRKILKCASMTQLLSFIAIVV